MNAPIEVPSGLWSELKQAYASPGRAYHTMDHVRAVLRSFDEVACAVGWSRPREVYLALLFHDAIYVPGASDNEARSAGFASEAIARWLPDGKVETARVARLIELTAAHGRLDPASLDRDEALFLDCDMSVLGAERAIYAAYAEGIAREYAAVPPQLYRAGRARFLRGVLEHGAIFLSGHFRERLERQARENLRWELEHLDQRED